MYKNISTITKTILAILLVTSNISVTKVYAEEETSSASSNTTEVSSKDYSEFIQSEVTYNEDKSIATAVISVDTEDDVKLDFSNNDTITEYMESSFSEVNQSDDEKSYTFNIVKNETYTFDAIVLPSDADATSSEAIGKKTITLNIDGLTETEDNTNQYEANEAASFTFSPISISNVDVAYFNWHNASDTTGTINFTKVADGATSLTVDNFRDATNAGYILFFVTPKDNYLFTGLGASGAGQAWVVGDKDDETFSADDYLDGTVGIGNWDGIKNVILAARKAGYVACFGFSRVADGTNPENQNFDLTAKVPTMGVTLILDHSDTGSLTNLLPGNKLYFQVVVTPETVTNATVQNVKLTSVHGETVDEELTEQSDGKYTTGENYIEYVITDDDWLNGRVKFNVEASVSYLCTYGLTKGTISTTSTINESAEAEAAPNPEYKNDVSFVKYAFQSADGSNLPDTVTDLLPSSETVELNTTVTPTAITETKIIVDNGYWEFTGWNPESATSSSTSSIITFTGTWKFRQSINPDDQGEYGQITVSTLSDVTYNGLSQQYNPTVTTEDGNTLDEDTDYTISFSNDTTNVGTVTVTVTGIGSYSGTVTRTYQIKPATFYVTTPSDTKVYDGKALTKAEGASITGLVNSETATLNVTGSQTAVGSSDNTYQVIWNGTAKESNYTHGTDSDSIGTLTVSEYAEKIVVTTTGGTFTYDGLAHAATVTVSELPDGYTLETATSNATATDVTTQDVVATCDNLVIKNAANEDVTDKLNITKVNGTIKITPAALTVTTPSDSKVYDGKALIAEGTLEGLVNGEIATFTTTGSQTSEGSSTNTYTLKFIGEDGASATTTAKRSNYTITETIGTLTVTRKSITPDDASTPEDQKTGITVTTPSSHKYDANAHQEVLTVKDTKTNNTLVKDTDYTVTYTRNNAVTDDFTNVGTITITIKGIGNYTGEFTRTYDITQRNVTINATSASKIYGASNPEFKYTLAEGSDSIIGTDLGEITVSRTSTNEAFGTYTDDLTVSYTENSNYNVVTNPADFVISRQSIDPEDTTIYSGVQIDSPENSKYDGNTHQWSPTVTDQNGNALNEGTDYTVSYSRSNTSTDDFTNVGEITVTITGSGSYSGTVTRTYKITPVTLYVTTPSDTKVYDGTALTKTEGASITGLVNNETATLNVTGSQTTVGSSKNTYEVVWGTATSSNYTVVDTDEEGHSTIGTLTVTGKSIIPDDTDTPETQKTGITVTTPSNHKYDSNEYKEVLTVTDTKINKPLVEKTDYTVTYTRNNAETNDFTNVGTITITIKGQGNYTGEFTRTYEITQRNVTINALPASKVYGADNPNFDCIYGEGSDNIIGKDLGDITVSRTSTSGAVGTYKNDLKVSYTENSNYKVVTNPADFVISAQSIIPKDEAYSGVQINSPENSKYDGKTHEWSPTVTTKNGAALDKDTDYTVTYSRGDTETTDFTNVGEITVYITGKGNYSGTVTRIYKITKRNVTLTSESASKTYDGTPLTKPNVTIGGDGFVDGEVSNVTATGSVTNVSESPVTNTITYTQETNYNDDNYTITKNEGTLSVIPQSISPKDKDGKDDPTYNGVVVDDPTNVTYDGNEHKFVPKVTKPDGSTKLEEGKDYTVTYTVTDPTTGEQVEIDDFTNVKGEITVTITGKDNYSGTITKTYEITPKPVTITVASESKVYDKLDPEFTATQTGLVKEDDLGKITAYRTNKDDENAGTYREVLDVTYTSNTNYTVTVIKGDFTIIPQSISPTKEDGSDDPTYNGVEVDDPTDVIYDGKEHKFVPEVTKPDGTKLEEGKDYTVTYTVTDPTTGEQVEIDDFTNVNGEITVTITGKDNYSGTIVKKYSIKQREIEFVGNSATKVYNGKEQAVGGYTIKLTDDTHGLVSGHTATLSAGASRKDEGTSTGSITPSDKVIIMNGEEDVTKNYKITTTPGSITIKCSGWDDGGPFTTDTCGNVFDRWGNKIYEATSCNVGGYNLVRTSVED